MKVAILILAAGQSSRMGTAKQLLPIGEDTLLGLVVKNALQSDADNTYCVLGANAEQILASLQGHTVDVIQNSAYASGMSVSIAKGIRHIDSLNFDAAVIILGDQPLVSTSFLNTLISALRKNTSYIIASKYTNGIGVPAIFPKKYFYTLQHLKGDQGAKELLNSHQIPVKTLSNCVNLLDIDTLDDYLNFKKEYLQET